VKISRIRIFKTDLPLCWRGLCLGKVGGDWASDIACIEAGVDLLEQGEIAMADANQAVAHFAASTRAEYLQNTTDLMNYDTRSTGIGGAWSEGGELYALDFPGLGVTPDFNSLGVPVAEYQI